MLRGVLPADERRRSRSGGRRGLAGLALGAAGEPGGIVVHAAVAATRRARVALIRGCLRAAVARGLAGAALERARVALQGWDAYLGEGGQKGEGSSGKGATEEEKKRRFLISNTRGQIIEKRNDARRGRKATGCRSSTRTGQRHTTDTESGAAPSRPSP